MPGYEDTHWASTDAEIATFRKKIEAMGEVGKSAEALVEIAIQLMRLNSHAQEIHTAIYTPR